jgi:hypothetical protein
MVTHMNRTKETDGPPAGDSLEQALDSFDPAIRSEALASLAADACAAKVLPALRPIANLHAHTFFSYNAYGYSPSHFAWLARTRGLAVAGIVDFDMLDGMEEFLDAGLLLGLKTCVGIETRVWVPEFHTREINSPGEPGIAYHMGVGFTPQRFYGPSLEFLLQLRRTSDQRNRDLITRVNTFTEPVRVDYAKDVMPLTPNGNATERHICLAFARKAAEQFPAASDLGAFWAEKLGESPQKLDLPAGPKLQALIRSRTMKRGGVGYVKPDRDTFPLLAHMNRFVREAGAIPTMTWLDGLSEGEQAMEEFMRVAMSSGAAALNIIPDRNFTPGVKDRKLDNLYAVVALAQKHGMPVIAGTEMNSPGQKFVDDFDVAELRPLVPVFLKGAHIVYAHTVLQRRAGLGYLSDWALSHLRQPQARNEFFGRVGELLDPERDGVLEGLDRTWTPARILDLIRG